MIANINNAQQGATDYLSSLYIPEQQAPSPPIAQEENFYINNSASELNKSGYIAMSPQKGSVMYRSDSPTTRKNLDTSPKHKKNKSYKSELPEEIPMLHNQNKLPTPKHTDSDSKLFNEHLNNSHENEDLEEKSFTKDEDGSDYKNVFDKNDNNYVNVSNVTNNPSYSSITFDKSNIKRH